MQESFQTNNYLQSVMSEVIECMTKNEEIPDELSSLFINELSVSTLLVPGIIEDDSLTFDAMTTEDEDVEILPLFTDIDEFEEFFGKDFESQPIPNDFEFYIELLRENDFEGIIINPGSDEFMMDRELLLELPIVRADDDDDGEYEIYDKEMLLKAAKDAKNESLVEFIRSDNDEFESLMMNINDSTLLGLVVSPQDLSEHAENGIISHADAGEFILSSIGDDETNFMPLFSDVDKIRNFIEDDEYNYYYQIVLMDDMIEFILKADMDGIVINPNVDDYLISRQYLLEAYGGLTYNDPHYEKASEYVFIL